MGTNVFALITEWPPMVDAYAEAGTFDFYWDANVRQNDMLSAAQQAGRRIDWDALPELLPYAWEHHVLGGRAHVLAPDFHDDLRAHLPPRVRDPLQALARTLYAGYDDENPATCDDLATDSGAPGDPSLLYTLRPSSVRSVLERFDAVPWTELSDLGESIELPMWAEDRYLPGWGGFEAVLYQQHEWWGAAAEQDRGVVVVVSQ